MYKQVAFWLFSGFFVTLYVVFLMNFAEMKIAREGKIVQMQIVKMSSKPWTTKQKGYVTMRYMERDFTVKVGGSFYDRYAVGNWIEMRYPEGESRLLFPGETGVGNFVALILLGVFFLYSLIYVYIKAIR